MKKTHISLLITFPFFTFTAHAESTVNGMILKPSEKLHFTYNKYDDNYNEISKQLKGLFIEPKNPMGKTPDTAIYIHGEVDNPEDFLKKHIYIKDIKILVDHENPSKYSSLYGITVKESNVEIDNIDITSKSKNYYGILNKNNHPLTDIESQVKSRVTINNGHLIFNGNGAKGIAAIMYSNNKDSLNETEFNNSVMDLNGESNRGIWSVNSLVTMNSSIINLNNPSEYNIFNVNYGIYALNNSNILINNSEIIGQANNAVGIYLGQVDYLLDEDTLSTNNIEYLNKEPVITINNNSNIKLQNSTAIYSDHGKGVVNVDNNSHIFSKNLIETKYYDKYDDYPVELTLNVSNNSTVEGRILTGEGTKSSTNISSKSAWNVTGDSVLTNLNVNDSVVNFKKGDDKFTTTEVDALDGSNATYNFAVDIVKNDGSKLIINKSSNGKSIVQVTNDGKQNTTGKEKILLVEDKSGTNAKATFSSDGKGIELGGYLYTVNRDSNTNNWYLTGGTAPVKETTAINNSAKTITGLASTSYLINKAEMSTLRQFMGDQKQARKSTSSDLSGAWGRVYSGNYKTRNNHNLAKADMNYYGFQLGGDINTIHYSDNANYVGVFMGHTTGKPDYENGDATATSWYGGFYDIFIADNGFYVDSVINLGQYRNKYNLKDSQNNAVDGKSHSSVITLSSQTGKPFTLTETDTYNVYAEPQAQLTYSRIGTFNTTASNGLRVKQGAYDSTIARLGIQLGTQFNKQSDIYLKTSYLHDFSKDVNYTLNDSPESYSVKGDGLEAGLGVNVKLNDDGYLYAEGDYINSKTHYTGSKFNIGYRYDF